MRIIHGKVRYSNIKGPMLLVNLYSRHHSGNATCKFVLQYKRVNAACEFVLRHQIGNGPCKLVLHHPKCQCYLKLDLMFMKHYAPNRCLYIKVAKLRTGVGSAETSYLQNCSVKLFKEHFKVQICKERLFEKNKITFLLIFTN